MKEDSGFFKINMVLIINICFYLIFYLLMFYNIRFGSIVEMMLSLLYLYFILTINIYRPITIFVNTFVTRDSLKLRKYEKLKIIFYSNFFSLILFIFLVYFKFAKIYYVLNVLTLYPEVIITTFFNIPILYIISSRVAKYKIIVLLIRISLVLMSIYNIYLLIDGEFLQSMIWLP